MSLIQKLFLFLIIAIILPLVVAMALISRDTRMLSQDVTANIHDLEEGFTTEITAAAEGLIKSSSEEMDQLTQLNWERLTVQISQQLATFLYDRDKDLLSLAAIASDAENIEEILNKYRQQKTRAITVPGQYEYDRENNVWQRVNALPPLVSNKDAENPENQTSFRYLDKSNLEKELRPLYREITMLDIDGREIHKSSDIRQTKIDTHDQLNTFAKAENYAQFLDGLNAGDIYVSDVIGVYVPTSMIGTYQADRLKDGQTFSPESSGYAGLENPKGKRFEGIIRFITPLIKNGQKTGYLTLALDHRHIMEFTDYVVPENSMGLDQSRAHVFTTDIKNARDGNYAFMWDHKGRSIAHPREYFISGFDAETGTRVFPWISKKRLDQFEASGAENINDWLYQQPAYQSQSRDIKPNVNQIQSGHIPLDCRYLDFAPQCAGWNQINETGGYGSFLIYWSDIWKLTTAATIPYYTGQYGDSFRGFGVVTIGASIGEFTRSSVASRTALNNTLGDVNNRFGDNIRQIGKDTADVLIDFQNQLLFIGIAIIGGVIGISVFASVQFQTRISKVLSNTAKLSAGDLSARINDSSKDEIGKISTAFDAMAETIAKSQEDLSEVNKNLENIVFQRTEELLQSNQQISDSIDYASRIQRSLLPNKDTMTARLKNTAIVWQPKDVVGGDFYWHKTIGDKDYLVVMDCTGHGVPGAFMTLIATSTLEQITAATVASLGRWVLTPEIDDLMQQLHEGICDQLNQVGEGSLSNDGLDAVMIARPHDGGPIEFCGAAMDLYTLSPDGQATRYRGNKTSIGYLNTGKELDLSVEYLAQDQGMTFVITTDGITTQIGEENRRSYGFRRFMQALENASDNSPKQVNRSVMRDFRSWQGKEERRDDVTLISFQPSPADQEPDDLS